MCLLPTRTAASILPDVVTTFTISGFRGLDELHRGVSSLVLRGVRESDAASIA